MKKAFFVEFTIHFSSGSSLSRGLVFWWSGKSQGLHGLKKMIAKRKDLTGDQVVERVEIKAMFECFGESAE